MADTLLQVHDPDTQNIPMFTTSPAFFSSIKSSYYNGFQFIWNSVADFTVQYQKYTYYPIMMIARFNLYYLSWLHLASARSIKRGTAAWIRPTEVLACLCYIYLFFYLLLWKSIPNGKDAWLFLLVSHMATLPLQIQITLSHWGASTSDLGPGEVFAQRQLRTTVDVACPEWLDFFHGGLQFQTVHHLFPRVPRHNLRKLSVLVRNFCEETGIDYQILGFVEGNHSVLGKLQHITDQAKILAACQKHMAATGSMNLPNLAEL
jgi:delta8-fatty-acid desaturase